MESKEKNTKEKILEEALKLFAQSGYMGTSMNDIASKLGVTKAALYKHYKSKQEILDSIIDKMNELDIERVKQYEMPEGGFGRYFYFIYFCKKNSRNEETLINDMSLDDCGVGEGAEDVRHCQCGRPCAYP